MEKQRAELKEANAAAERRAAEAAAEGEASRKAAEEMKMRLEYLGQDKEYLKVRTALQTRPRGARPPIPLLLPPR